MIIEIALGIVLGVILLFFLPSIIGLGLYLIPIILILSVLVFALSKIPEDWIQQVLHSDLYLLVIPFLIFAMYSNFADTAFFKRITEKKIYKILTNKISFVEKIFGEKSSSNIIGFIVYIICLVVPFIAVVSIPFVILAILELINWYYPPF